jgi:hypothetical protein
LKKKEENGKEKEKLKLKRQNMCIEKGKNKGVKGA